MVTYKKLLEGIKQNNFLVVGRVGMDFYPDPAGTAIEDGTLFMSSMGGSAANTAAGICKLGGNASLVTRVSDDAVGKFCLAQLDKYGIGREYVKNISGEFRTSLAVYESRLEDHQTVIYRNGAADFEMNEDDVKDIDYGSYGALITAGTVFAAEPSRTAAFKAMELASVAGLPIIFDVDYRPYSWPSLEVAEDVLSRAAAYCDLIIGNDEEFGFMAGGIDKGLEKARSLNAEKNASVIYKMGPKGAVSFIDGEEISTGIYRVDALKPTGAGDSFCAGLLASIASGHDFKSSILRGSACAAITVSKPGCAPAMPTLAQLEDFLGSHAGAGE